MRARPQCGHAKNLGQDFSLILVARSQAKCDTACAIASRHVIFTFLKHDEGHGLGSHMFAQYELNLLLCHKAKGPLTLNLRLRVLGRL